VKGEVYVAYRGAHPSLFIAGAVGGGLGAVWGYREGGSIGAVIGAAIGASGTVLLMLIVRQLCSSTSKTAQT